MDKTPAARLRPTRNACYLGYITQAIAINLLSLLYVTLQRDYGISLEQISLLITVCFVVQIAVDLIATRSGERLSYRSGTVAANAAVAAGLVALGILPRVMPVPYVGVMIAVVLMAIGGGLTEVLISPLIDRLPSDEKAGSMSLLHSFYCWGYVAVVALSTLYFALFGTDTWWLLSMLWAIGPAATAVLFAFVPMPDTPPAVKENGSRGGLRRLLSTPVIWLLMLLMICSGAAEQGISQWASLFAEKGLHVSKSLGDLLGPLLFAVLMGIARAAFGRMGSTKILGRTMTVCAAGCIGGYLLVALSPWPVLSLLGIGICGLSVGVMWPGSLSLSSDAYPAGGTAMFALLALCGDVGCVIGPGLVGTVSDRLIAAGQTEPSALRIGIVLALIFPLGLLLGVSSLGRKRK